VIGALPSLRSYTSFNVYRTKATTPAAPATIAPIPCFNPLAAPVLAGAAALLAEEAAEEAAEAAEEEAEEAEEATEAAEEEAEEATEAAEEVLEAAELESTLLDEEEAALEVFAADVEEDEAADDDDEEAAGAAAASLQISSVMGLTFRASVVEQALRTQGVALAVIASLAVPHWHAKSVAPHPADEAALIMQVWAQAGIEATSSAMVWE